MSAEWNSLPAPVRAVIRQYQDVPKVRLVELAKALQVPILAATLAPGISGEIRPNNDRSGFVIKVNRHDPPTRQRFTVAHELAHFLLHAEEIGDGIADDVLYRSTLTDAREQQANRLAADILMPTHLLEAVKQRLQAVHGEERVLRLAEIFVVSDAAMRIRVGA